MSFRTRPEGAEPGSTQRVGDKRPMLAPLLLLLQTAPGVAQDPPLVFHGARGETDVRIPKIAEHIEIDGLLDEDVWRQAAVLTGFSQYSPVDGLRSQDSTEVLIWYSADAMHFGVRAFELHGTVRATLADRDRIDSDDQIQILLDTFNDNRRAWVIGVNPFGIQSDGVRTEGARNRRRLLSAESNDNPVDLKPDLLYESKGHLTPGGYEIEIRVPLKSLRYQAGHEQDWGINVLRRIQHSGRLLSWVPARRGRASFLAQSGRLRQLHGLHRGIVLDVNPVATAKVEGTPTAGGWDYDAGAPDLGGNVRWGVTANLTLNGTYKPDFSQVEADAGQAVLDPRRAVFFAEKRPFFLEGSEQFDTPNRLIYTRRIISPVGAVKLVGKVSGTEVGYLAAVDDRSLSSSGEHPVFNILRVRRDIGEESTVGVAYTDRFEGSHYNRVAGADARLVFGKVYTFAAQTAASFTRDDAGTTRAPLWNVTLNRRGRRFAFDASINGMHADFVAASGFISRPGVVRPRLRPTITVYGREGAVLESWTTGISAFGTWRYEDFFAGRESESIHLWFTNSFAFRGGWRLGASLIVESFGYPAYLYSDYAVERQTATDVDTVAFVGTTSRIPNYGAVLNVATPQFSRFSASLSAIVARDENFDEWAPAYLLLFNGGINWRPTEQLRIDARYIRQQYVRPDDGTTVSVRDVPRLKIEYQATRGVFLRFLGQYDARFRDALRDDTRTNDPILIRNAETGVYERALEQTDNDFRLDWLFSFQPTPGTLLFVGYGATLTEPDSFRFRGMNRTADGFFFKLSYLFRV